MKIKTTKGHLTATNKSHIKAMFEQGIFEAKVNRINYFITPLGSHYGVKTSQIYTKTIGSKPTLNWFYAEFETIN